jgi:hypothetical protein
VNSAEEEIDRLYGLPLNEFTEARNALARRFRDSGERAIAERIKELCKPTLPAWVINQLGRQRELDVQRLLKAGERLASAQGDAIRSQSQDAFLDARREEQHALERLAERANDILAKAGRGNAPIDRVLATLRAASLTAAGRALLKGGRLTEELEPPGFEALEGLGIPRDQRRRPPTVPNKTPSAARQAQRETTRTETRRKRKLAADARRRVQHLRRQLRQLEARSAMAERQTRQIKEQLQAAEAETDALAQQRQRAEDELSAAERDLKALT